MIHTDKKNSKELYRNQCKSVSKNIFNKLMEV